MSFVAVILLKQQKVIMSIRCARTFCQFVKTSCQSVVQQYYWLRYSSSANVYAGRPQLFSVIFTKDL